MPLSTAVGHLPVLLRRVPHNTDSVLRTAVPLRWRVGHNPATNRHASAAVGFPPVPSKAAARLRYRPAFSPQRLQKGDQCLAAFRIQRAIDFFYDLSFAPVPKDRLFQRSGTTVMQETGTRVDYLGQTDPPQRRGTPLLIIVQKLGTVFGQSLPHVVQ